ncbi:hypothetical protein BpHYR1_053079 [Brachionus plicatilis]|uniref:MHD2 domain-containing protein n=1 Tax=Brachionus plicatilis TaxID=10195 RepID=A0A3M7PNA0_BRAPC|nr:hypothetical protein BpHYR1_053079 [Brachionus plicatilis]
MCVRLNNLLQLRELHSNIYAGFNKQASRYYNHLIKMSDRNTLPVFQQFKLEIYSLKVTSKNLQNKLDKIYRGLILLLVYRFNLFCKRAIFLLASEHYSQSPVNIRIKPLVDFLTDNFKMLKQKLFSKIFLQFVKNLWNSFHHTFVELIDKFEDESAKNPQQQALNYLKIVEIMTTKFKDYTPNHKFLESKMGHIILLLNLYAQNTSTLILLYYKLFNFNYQTKETIEFDRIHLVKIGKKLSKKFSGKFFIKFLKKNPPSQIQSNLINKDYLISYSQRLLESGFIKPIQFEKSCSISKNSKKSVLSDSADDSLVLKSFCAENIFLATVTNYYMLDQDQINKLVDNLLFKNSIINQEIEVLFNDVKNLNETLFMKESDELFDKCIKNSIIDHDLIVRILWHRIYQEPLVMKFISMRHSNFANDSYLKKILPNRTSDESFEFEYAIMHLI